LVPPVLDQLASGTLRPLPQAEGEVTRAPKMKKEMGAIDWNRTAAQIDWHIRAMQPWPQAFTWVFSAGKPPQRLLVLGVKADQSAVQHSLSGGQLGQQAANGPHPGPLPEGEGELAGGGKGGTAPGTILRADKQGLWVQTGSIPVEI